MPCVSGDSSCACVCVCAEYTSEISCLLLTSIDVACPWYTTNICTCHYHTFQLPRPLPCHSYRQAGRPPLHPFLALVHPGTSPLPPSSHPSLYAASSCVPSTTFPTPPCSPGPSGPLITILKPQSPCGVKEQSITPVPVSFVTVIPFSITPTMKGITLLSNSTSSSSYHSSLSQ